MATQNVRIVGYLPPNYHAKLREYMEKESLTESAAIVKIVKQFFDGPAKQPETIGDSAAIESLRVSIVQLQQRLSILEEAVASGVKKGRTSSTKTLKAPLPTLPPQNQAELARRLGVNPSSIEEASSKGEDYFQDWSKRRDPAKKAWQKRGNLYHPLPE